MGYLVNNNGNVLSFLYKSFQVDLIKVPLQSVDYSKNYFSWNDAGNLVGRMSKSLGFKHSHYGLYFIHRNDANDKIYNEYLLSLDYKDVLNYLELDVEKYINGFNNKKELFDWVVTSPYFNADKFKFSNLNHQNKVRDRKRTTYNDFLKYLEANDLYTKQPLKVVTDKLSFIYAKYPALELNVNRDLEKESIAKHINQYFNGKLIAEITGISLQTKDLGSFIKYFKSQTTQDILLKSIEDFKTVDLILDLYKEYLINVN